MKILFAGNSITLHAPAPDIGWTGNYGMAASRAENDYVYRLCDMIAGRGRIPESMVCNIADFEREPDLFPLDRLAKLRDYGADIIIIRIAENTPAEKLSAFGEAYPRLIEYLNPDGRSRVFCVGSFWPSGADPLIRTAAESAGAVYVSLERLHSPEYRAVGLFSHAGVAAHPSDKGMLAIAETIIEAIDASGLLNRALVYPLPDGERGSDDYTVTVDGQRAPCYACRVSAMPFNRTWPGCQRLAEQSEQASFVYFDMSAPAEITVTAAQDFSEATLRPQSAGVTCSVSGRTILFTIRKPGQFSLELDGRHHNLHIFANPVDKYKTGADTLYFGPGLHEAGDIELRDGQTLFVDAGAVVHASVRCADSSNVRIIGHGILDYSRFERHDPLEWERDGLINLIRCENVTVDGVILRDASWWSITAFNCRNLRYNNVKTIGMWRYNSDGFDFVNSQNVHVSDCFLRNFDDVIVLKGMRVHNIEDGREIPLHYEHMNLQNYLIEGCVVWCDWGGGLEIGAETVADEYSNIIFRDCDIIRNSDGAMRIQSGDRALIHNVLYENIRVEYSKYDRASVYQHGDDMSYAPEDKPSIPPVICGWMYRGMWTQDMLYGNIRGVTYRNIYILADEGLPAPPVSFMSADAGHRFDGITIDGLYFNGSRITEPDLRTNEFTGSITIK
ncbi:MAG: glycosyl hydrolase family 28 protein [Eubacteriales bacterium]|nr:glycosyl hydrolase family 28 protein [Eubacteriales bacterium]